MFFVLFTQEFSQHIELFYANFEVYNYIDLALKVIMQNTTRKQFP